MTVFTVESCESARQSTMLESQSRPIQQHWTSWHTCMVRILRNLSSWTRKNHQILSISEGKRYNSATLGFCVPSVTSEILFVVTVIKFNKVGLSTMLFICCVAFTLCSVGFCKYKWLAQICHLCQKPYQKCRIRVIWRRLVNWTPWHHFRGNVWDIFYMRWVFYLLIHFPN